MTCFWCLPLPQSVRENMHVRRKETTFPRGNVNEESVNGLRPWQAWDVLPVCTWAQAGDEAAAFLAAAYISQPAPNVPRSQSEATLSRAELPPGYRSLR